MTASISVLKPINTEEAMTTTEPDWADEIANKISPRKEAFGDAIADAIARALRRAKAAGLREAAEIAYLEVLKADNVPRKTGRLKLPRGTYCHEYAAAAKAAIRAAADKLEGKL